MLLLALVALVAVGSASNYCELCRDHTMCLRQGIAPACLRGDRFSGCTEEDISTIVSEHNALRQKVASGEETRGNPGPQPPAADMQDLTWDVELANIAQRWADQCEYAHDSCRKVSRFYVGQNIAETSVKPCSASAKKPDWKQIIGKWYDEVEEMDNRKVASYSSYGPVVGHYTQIVWATTTRIGCGYRFYEGGYGWCYSYYVCNYGEGGNIRGQPVYLEGHLLKGEGGSSSEHDGQGSIYDDETEQTGKGEEEYYENGREEVFSTTVGADGTLDTYDEESADKSVNINYAGSIYGENGPDSILSGEDEEKEAQIGKDDERQPIGINENKGELPTDKDTGQLPGSQGGKQKTGITPSETQAGEEYSEENTTVEPKRSSNEASSYNAQFSLLTAVALFIVLYYV